MAAHRHNAYLPYVWNERIPAERDAFFLQFIHERMPENVMLVEAYSRIIWSRIIRMRIVESRDSSPITNVKPFKGFDLS